MPSVQQYWDDVLYPAFRASIRGTIYGVITADDMDEECYNFACRAISAFKFPRISTAYVTFYGNRSTSDPTVIIETDDDDTGIPHAYFTNTLTYSELEVIIAWMKVYWCEYQISNADNFEDTYTDVNIKSFSRANAIDKNLRLLETYRSYARDLETRYGRVSATQTPTMGDVNNEDD